MDISLLRKQKEEKMSALFKECRVFFAFSEQAFQDNKTVLREGEKYRRLCSGGFIPQFSADDFLKGSKEIEKWFKDIIKSNKSARIEHIKYELSNYECYVSGDIQEALDVLGKGYSRKEVMTIFLKERVTKDF